jgi:hypothetical protein
LTSRGASRSSWVDPKLPASLNNRDVDNWIPLLFVAEQAGGPWPDLAAKAVEEMMKTERQPTVTVRLLRSIWAVYQPDPDEEATKFLPTSELVAKLIGDEDEEWDTMGPAGRGITPQWLRERLAHLLDPPGSTRESAFGPRGYAFRQFAKALERYLGAHPAIDTLILDTSPGGSGSSGSTGEEAEKASKIKGDFEPDEKSHPAREQKHPARQRRNPIEPDAAGTESDEKSHPAHEKPRDSAKNGDEIPVEPDEPVSPEGVSLYTSHPDDDWGWTSSTAELPSAAAPEKQPENREDSPPPTTRPRRAKPTGLTSRSRPAPQLDIPEPSLIDYIEGSIAVEVRQLRDANPNRSIEWIAKQSGQPRSVIRAILGDGEGAP